MIKIKTTTTSAKIRVKLPDGTRKTITFRVPDNFSGMGAECWENAMGTADSAAIKTKIPDDMGPRAGTGTITTSTTGTRALELYAEMCALVS